MTISGRPNRAKTKMYYYAEWGRVKGQRKGLDVFTYIKPVSKAERDHNREVQNILAVKKSQIILNYHATGSGYIPIHNLKENFLDYYQDFVKHNRKFGNRHLEGSLTQFKTFLDRDFIAPIEITEDLCTRFRQYLLKHFNGDTPANYGKPTIKKWASRHS